MVACNLGKPAGPIPACLLNEAQSQRSAQISGGLWGVKASRCLWLVANEVGKGWGYIFTLSGFVLMMWCVLSQAVIACALIHSFGSHDFPVGCVGSPKAPFHAFILKSAITFNLSLAASRKGRCSAISGARFKSASVFKNLFFFFFSLRTQQVGFF